MNTLASNSSHNQRRSGTTWLASLVMLALMLPLSAWAGGIRGILKDDQGHPIRRGEVCLLSEASSAKWQCIKSRHSARNGKYVFSNLAKGVYYVSVRTIDSMGPDHEWLPNLRQVVLEKSSSIAKAVDFGWISQGSNQSFKFNNFKNDQPLTAADFPELAQFDPNREEVFLKLYVATPDEESKEQILFLGRMDNVDAFKVNPSLLRSQQMLTYEIFSASHTISGTLNLR